MSTQAQVSCPECDTDNPYSVLICWACGAKLPFAEVVATQKKQRESRVGAAQHELQAAQHNAPQHTHAANWHAYLLAMALWLFVVVACGYFSLRAPAPASVVNDATITLDEYEQLRIGMSYKECVNALGATGYQQDLTYIRESRLTITTYIWQNQDGSNVMAEFENGRLTTKVQAGLHTPKPVVQQQLLYGATAPFFPDYALEGPSSSPRRGAPHDHSPLSPSR